MEIKSGAKATPISEVRRCCHWRIFLQRTFCSLQNTPESESHHIHHDPQSVVSRGQEEYCREGQSSVSPHGSWTSHWAFLLRRTSLTTHQRGQEPCSRETEHEKLHWWDCKVHLGVWRGLALFLPNANQLGNQQAPRRPSCSRAEQGLRWEGGHFWVGEKPMWLPKRRILRTWLLNVGSGALPTTWARLVSGAVGKGLRLLPSLLRVLVPSPVLYLMHRGILRWQNM